jgi:hypothetical protein
LGDLQRGLRDVLFSRIGKAQRDPAIKLVSAVVEASRDFDWCVRSPKKDKDGKPAPAPVTAKCKEEGGKFLLVVVNLSCIEVIMHLEEKSLETVAASADDVDLLVSCYVVLENAIAYLAADDGDEKLKGVLDVKQMGQILAALKNAFMVVLKFLKVQNI